MPIVSILTAAHARSKTYLEATIASVQQQVLPPGWDLEWVVQEDGSAPSMADWLSAIPGVRYSANGAQLGISSTRNLALSRVTGDLVQVLDSDDILLPNALATLIPKFLSNPIRWAVGQADDLLPDGTRKSWNSEIPFGVLSPGFVNDWARRQNGNWPIHCAGLMMHTQTLRAVGGWAGIPYDDDIAMFAALSEIASGYHEPAVTWLYRQHPEQVTKSEQWRAWSDSGRLFALQRAASVRASGLVLDTRHPLSLDADGALRDLRVGPPAKG